MKASSERSETATPIVLFSFNRPEATRRNLEVLRQVRPTRLFLVADAPRTHSPSDEENCAAVRSILAGVDWPSDVRRIYNDENLGCTGTIESGLDAVFAECTEAIILEDDCIPDLSFIPFCAELLERYRHLPLVAYISGFAIDTPPSLFGAASYAFTGVGAGWGWATWRDRWRAHRARFPREHAPSTMPYDDSKTLANALMLLQKDMPTVSPGVRYAMRQMVRTQNMESALPWDALFGLSVMTEASLAITPRVNMITNIGFGTGATHNVVPKSLPRGTSMSFPLGHPPTVAIDRRIAAECELDFLWFPVGRARRRLRHAVPVGTVRLLLLRTLTSTAVLRARSSMWAIMRVLARVHSVVWPGGIR